MLDVAFLKVEDCDRNASLGIGGLAVLEGPMPAYTALIPTLAQRVGACPRLRQRLRLRPLDIDAPEWVDDPKFDIAHHVRRIALPGPGGDEELFRVVADVMSSRLDRSRPLWEVWIIEGLTNGRWGILNKVHHCLADGISMVHMLMGLSDQGVGDSFASRVGNARETAPLGPQLNQFMRSPFGWVSGLPTMASAVTTAAARAACGARELAAGLLHSSPSSLNGPITGLRRYSAARVSLPDLRRVSEAFDVTINDVALAAITDSYRALLIRRGEQPLPGSLRTLVPVSMRTVDAFDKTDNRVSAMLPCLPVEEEHPIQRLRTVHSLLTQAKSHGQRQAGNAVISVANSIPFVVTAWAARLLFRLPQRGVVTLATNVPGPRKPLRVMGRKVVAVMPVPPIAMQLRTGVAMLSYGDDMFFGILADFDAVPDGDELAQGIEAAVATLVARTKRRRVARKDKGLSLVVSA